MAEHHQEQRQSQKAEHHTDQRKVCKPEHQDEQVERHTVEHHNEQGESHVEHHTAQGELVHAEHHHEQELLKTEHHREPFKAEHHQEQGKPLESEHHQNQRQQQYLCRQDCDTDSAWEPQFFSTSNRTPVSLQILHQTGNDTESASETEEWMSACECVTSSASDTREPVYSQPVCLHGLNMTSASESDSTESVCRSSISSNMEEKRTRQTVQIQIEESPLCRPFRQQIQRHQYEPVTSTNPSDWTFVARSPIQFT